MARDAGRQLPFTDEVPPTGSQGPHQADRQAPGARTSLGVRVRGLGKPRARLWVWLGDWNRGWFDGPWARLGRLAVLVRHPVVVESTGYWPSLAHRSLPPL